MNLLKTKTEPKRLSKKSRNAKKITLIMTIVACIAAIGCMSCFAAVNSSQFISKTQTVLTAVISLIGAGLGVWGVVNLIEGYGNDNPGAKSQGMKQLMAGVALIAVGIIIVPVLGNMMSQAQSG
jgi:hypothetical protein